MIYVTGDTHIPIDISKLNTTNFPEQHMMTKQDYVIICGDFGLIWNNAQSKEELCWTKWLNQKPFTTLFVDGNHENFSRLNRFPEEEFCGGRVHRISDSILHLQRGQVFEIQGKKIFTFGGAASVDKECRIEYISWWPQELPSFEEQQEAFDSLRKHDFKVDYVITHTAPAQIVQVIFPHSPHNDPTGKFLEAVRKEVEYKHWYFGHLHMNQTIGSFTGLYNKITYLK